MGASDGFGLLALGLLGTYTRAVREVKIVSYVSVYTLLNH